MRRWGRGLLERAERRGGSWRRWGSRGCFRERVSEVKFAGLASGGLWGDGG